MGVAMFITVNPGRAETDELCVCFYRCPVCGFERIPRLKDNDSYAAMWGDAQTMTARYCPGCQKEIVWVAADAS